MLEGGVCSGRGNRGRRECECEKHRACGGDEGGKRKEGDKEEDCDGTKLVRGHLAKFSILQGLLQ